jgi:hypothetical protein
MRGLRERKYLVLFLTAVLLLAVQPLAHGFFAGVLLYDALLTLVAGLAFVIAFEQRRQRLVALVAGLTVVASNWAAYGLSGPLELASVLVYHCSVVLFFGFAVVVMLHTIFKHRVGRTDDVMGVLCGYLFLGVAWGNLYVLVEVLAPGSFSVKGVLAGQLVAMNPRRFLFNYFSFVTLTTVGYGDVTPASPTAAWLACLEAVAGQFYVAVVVAQFVGLKLAQATRREEAG